MDSSSDSEVEQITASQSSASQGRQPRSVLTPSPLVCSSTSEEKSDSEPEYDFIEQSKARQAKKTAPAAVKKNSANQVSKDRIQHLKSSQSSSRAKKGAEHVVTPSKRKNFSTKSNCEELDDSTDDDFASIKKRTRTESPHHSSQKTSSNCTKKPFLETATVKSKVQPRKNVPKTAPRSQMPSTSSQGIFSQQQGTYSVPGVIKSLHLKNFMCHTDFTHHFHSNLNFVSGQNGSGKSALLSAILIALGGKASVTSRTNSLKSLVQRGKSSFRVAITLHNNDNGLPRYGEEITIERHVTASGGGGYRIRTVGGAEPDNRWRVLKKQELQNILTGLNIQIDNPVAILNQEVARSFLRSKDPKVKFNLFYDGTLLSKLESCLEDSERSVEETKGFIKQNRRTIHVVKSEVVQLQLKVNKIEELNKMKDDVDKIHNEYLWSVVVQYEKEKDKAEENVVRNAKELKILTSKLEETKNSLKHLNEESLLEQQNQVKRQLLGKKSTCDENKKELLEVKQTLSNLNMKLKTAVGAIKNREAQIEKLSSQIEKVRKEEEAKTNEKSNEDEEKLKELQDRKKYLESVSATLKLDADNFQLEGDRLGEELQGIKVQERTLRSRVEQNRKNLSNLRNDQNKYAVFGRKMEQLMAKVEANRHKFRKPPRGPLGACIRVKDPQFAGLVEGILKNQLDTFVVDNGMDLNLLRGLINSVYNLNGGGASQSQGRPSGIVKPPGIVMTRYADQLYDVSRHKATIRTAPTVFDILEVENNDHIVMNALIDIAEIERVLLFKNYEDACEVMKDESRCPPSLKAGYTLQWFRFTPAPYFGARPLPRSVMRPASILKSGRSQESMKRELQEAIRTLQVELEAFGPRIADLQAEINKHQSLFDKKMGEYQKVRRQLGETINELKRHQDRMKQRLKRFDFSTYYEELEELKEDLVKQQEDRDKYSKEAEEYRPRYTELTDARKAIVEEIERLNAEFNAFTEALDKLTVRRTEIENILQKIHTKVSKLQSTKDELDTALKQAEAVVQEKILAASSGGKSRIRTKHSPDALKKELDAIKLRIRETERHLGDQDALRQRLAQRHQYYTKLVNDLKPIENVYKLIAKVVENQRSQFVNMKSHMGRTLTLFFSVLARQRGYEGRLLVDFDLKELYYFICPDGDSSSKTINAIDAQQSQIYERDSVQGMRNNKIFKKALVEYSLGLSGGERSYATICFILALWQAMECPFYMLDEFDVFMDAFNRKVSQQALIGHAQQFTMHQFVLFSPLDIGDIPGPEEACLLRLYPPVRGHHRVVAAPAAVTVGEVDPIPGTSASQGTVGGGPQCGGRVRRRHAGKSNRNSDDCVENIDPLQTQGNRVN